MKLSEALIQRADVQNRLSRLQQRLIQSALVQEGSKAPEDPKRLLKEMDQLLAELERLVKQINRTNLSVQVSDGKSMTDALAERDTLMMEIRMISALAAAAVPQQNRYSRSEVKFLPMINVADIQKRLDVLAQRHRAMDMLIQSRNWEADLME